MGKREVQVVVVPMLVTVGLLLLVTIGMAAAVYWLSGKAYLKEVSPLDLLSLVRRDGQGLSSSTVLASLMPGIADALLFLPWGALMFLAVDRSTRPRWQTYLITSVVGLL